MNMNDTESIIECWQTVEWMDILMAQRDKSLIKNWSVCHLHNG